MKVDMLTIGAAAKATGLKAKTIRYYADIGLVEPEGREENGYRLYGDRSLRKLVFVKRARAFGFSVEECRALLDLYEDSNRSSADVKSLAQQRLSEIESKMAELQLLHDELSHLAKTCHGDGRPDCPILDALGG